MRVQKRHWNTYAVSGYTHQVGGDPRATGGIHRHEVRHTGVGWQKRIVDANGCFESPGDPEFVSSPDGEILFSRACSY